MRHKTRDRPVRRAPDVFRDQRRQRKRRGLRRSRGCRPALPIASASCGGRRPGLARAYLSNSAVGGAPAISARDRIGRGPWRNAKGDVIAQDVNELHGKNNLTKQTALTEKGDVVSGNGDSVNTHDILTGSSADGRALPGDKDMTCGNWTRSGEGAAMVGHHDRLGLRDDEPSRSWNASHPSRGCSQENLRSSGGAGLIYCFATN